MTAREGRRLAKMSRPSLVLAASSSAAVAAAAVTGYDLGAAEVVGAVALAGTIVALNRSRPEARPHVLAPMPQSFSGGVRIAAPSARALATQPARHFDAA